MGRKAKLTPEQALKAYKAAGNVKNASALLKSQGIDVSPASVWRSLIKTREGRILSGRKARNKPQSRRFRMRVDGKA
jgi:hypothetical protein